MQRRLAAKVMHFPPTWSHQQSSQKTPKTSYMWAFSAIIDWFFALYCSWIWLCCLKSHICLVHILLVFSYRFLCIASPAPMFSRVGGTTTFLPLDFQWNITLYPHTSRSVKKLPFLRVKHQFIFLGGYAWYRNIFKI